MACKVSWLGNLVSVFWGVELDLLSLECNGVSSSEFWGVYWFGGHLSCSFTCWIFLCLFILFWLLCLWWPFCRLEVCGSSLLGRLLLLSVVGCVVCYGFLVREACIHVLMGGAGSLLSDCNEVPSSEFWVACGFGVTLGILYFNAQGYVPVFLENQHGMSCSGTCWLLGGAWFQCRYARFWMSSCQLMFPGVRSSLVFSGFGFKPPASGFQS